RLIERELTEARERARRRPAQLVAQPAKVGDDLPGGRISIFGLLGETPGDDALKVRRRLRFETAQRRRVGGENLWQRLRGTFAVKRAPSADRFVHDAAEREDVRARGRSLAVDLL